MADESNEIPNGKVVAVCDIDRARAQLGLDENKMPPMMVHPDLKSLLCSENDLFFKRDHHLHNCPRQPRRVIVVATLFAVVVLAIVGAIVALGGGKLFGK